MAPCAGLKEAHDLQLPDLCVGGMSAPLHTSAPRWSTSAFGAEPHPSPLETGALQDHLQLCNGQTGRLFRLHCGADALHRLIAGRFATVLLGAGLLLALAAWWA
jgi:hypothetical protein